MKFRNLQFRSKPMGNGKDPRRHSTLEVKNAETQTVSWSRDYPHEMPAVWPAEDNRMVLAWDLNNESAKAEIKNNPLLQSQVKSLPGSKKGLLVETVVPETELHFSRLFFPRPILVADRTMFVMPLSRETLPSFITVRVIALSTG